MGKLIAVWGSPGSGKTTFSVKLAEALNSRSKKSAGHKTLVVFTDLTSPVVPVVFPNRKSEDIYSLGSVLVKTDLSPNVIFSNTITDDTTLFVINILCHTELLCRKLRIIRAINACAV